MRNFDEMTRMFEQMDQMFSGARDGPMGRRDSMTNLFEDDGRYVFVMDLPGFETAEIDLRFQDGELRVTASTELDEETETSYRRTARNVTETVTVPGEIDVDGIEASYHNGVLEVTLPTLADATPDGHVIDVR